MNRILSTNPKKWNRKEILIYLTFASLLLSLSSRFFINIVGTFIPGIAGLSQGITYTLWNVISQGGETALGMTRSQFVNNFYVLINWMINIPIIVFAFNKVGKKFSYYSLYVMLTTILFTLLFTNLPGIKDVFPGTNLDALRSSTNPKDVMLQYSIFTLIGLFGGISYGFACGLVFKVGYSTMGFDPVAKYLEIEKSMNINKTLFIFSIINSIVWIGVCAITSHQVTNFETFITSTFLSPTMATTVIFIGSYGIVSNITYPSLKQVSIEVISDKYDELAKELVEKGLIERYTLRKIKTGFKNQELESIFIITNSDDSKYLTIEIKNIDPLSVITINKLEKAITNMRMV